MTFCRAPLTSHLSSSSACLEWRRQWQCTPVLLPGKAHGWGGLVGYSPWGRKESDTTEGLHFTSLLSRDGDTQHNLLLWTKKEPSSKLSQGTPAKSPFFFWPLCTACTTWFPNQGSNPCPLQWKHRVLTTGPPGKWPGQSHF